MTLDEFKDLTKDCPGDTPIKMMVKTDTGFSAWKMVEPALALGLKTVFDEAGEPPSIGIMIPPD